MNILVINSSPMFISDDGGKYIYKETGKFLAQLQLNNSVENFHFYLATQNNDGMANFDLNSIPIKCTGVKRLKSKLLSYWKALPFCCVRLFKSDFLYLFYPNSFGIMGFVAWVLNKPFALYVRGEKGLNSKLSKFLFKKASFVLTVSPAFSQRIGSINKRTYTIRPMMAFSLDDLIQNRRFETPSVLKILFVGRIEIEKGVFELADAVIKLINAGDDRIKVTMVGDGKDSDKLKEYLNRKMVLEKYFEFTGSVYDSNILKDYYLNRDLFILPTHHEGFPRVLYEAMLFGIPIATTFVGTIGFLMKENYNCFKVLPFDSESVYNIITKAIYDYKSCSYLSQNGTKTILNYFSSNPKTHIELFKENLNLTL